jgi:MazG family protein
MRVLRSPRGCPWDAKQTHRSLRPYLVEEAYEVLETIDRGDLAALPGELGDLLFQCVFHAQIGADAQRFDITDVVDAITAKLVGRHPHVFSPDGTPLTARARARSRVTTPGAVIEQWSQIKAREQSGQGRPPRLLAGVPRALPALQRASKIGARAATVGFDWPDPAGVMDKIDEEVRELRAALGEGRARSVEEFGDLLFSLANLARKLEIEPETALRQANDKFTRRFDALEAHLETRGRAVHDASPDELEAAWQHVKTAQAARAPRRPSTSRPSTSARGSGARRSRR